MNTEKTATADKKIQVQKPDYTNCIANLACSVLKEFDVPAPHEGLPLMEEILKGEHKYKNVVILLLDGLGTALVEEALEPDGFFRSHLRGSFSSVFPPTTVASTTSFQSGLFPNEHAWLGWDIYFQEINKTVTVFRNKDAETNMPITDIDAGWKLRPYKTVVDRVSEAGSQAHTVSFFADPELKSFKGIMRRIKKLCSQDGRKFIYGYCEEPDHTLHRDGRPESSRVTWGRESVSIIKKLEKRTELICSELHDTLFIVTADHGHLNCRNYCLEDYPDFADCLDRIPSIEPRAFSVFLKVGREKDFLTCFDKYFKDDFRLYSREEIIKEGLFGPVPGEKAASGAGSPEAASSDAASGTARDTDSAEASSVPHPAFHDSLGDYILVAVSDASIYGDRETTDKFRSSHAGLTADEMNIPFIAIECK